MATYGCCRQRQSVLERTVVKRHTQYNGHIWLLPTPTKCTTRTHCCKAAYTKQWPHMVAADADQVYYQNALFQSGIHKTMATYGCCQRRPSVLLERTVLERHTQNNGHIWLLPTTTKRARTHCFLAAFTKQWPRMVAAYEYMYIFCCIMFLQKFIDIVTKKSVTERDYRTSN